MSISIIMVHGRASVRYRLRPDRDTELGCATTARVHPAPGQHWAFYDEVVSG
jgi:hypothetical protein